jgi:CBS domain-containing protein
MASELESAGSSKPMVAWDESRDFQVRELMTPGVVAVPADASVDEAARALVAHRVHAILVVSPESGMPLGWVTAQGLRSWRGPRRRSATAADAMSEEVVGVEPGATVAAALYALSMPGVSRLVVRHRGTGFPIGVITDLDLVDPEGSTHRR